MKRDWSGPLLEVRGLTTRFQTGTQEIVAVDDVSFQLEKGSALGVVGESGCGKSTLALSLLRLIVSPGRIVSGAVLFEGTDLLSLPEEKIRSVRGRRIGLVFQEPAAALNPVMTIGAQLGEGLCYHLGCSRAEAREQGQDWLNEVGIDDPRACWRAYPHQLSGGMRQRVLIAMVLSCEPDLLIGDEPTRSLDVETQAAILALLMRLREKLNLTMILISHDIGIIRQATDTAMVMFGGQVVESGPCREVLRKPAHPYTEMLLDALEWNLTAVGEGVQVGTPPLGCRFQVGCREREPLCLQQDIGMYPFGLKQVRCRLRRDSECLPD